MHSIIHPFLSAQKHAVISARLGRLDYGVDWARLNRVTQVLSCYAMLSCQCRREPDSIPLGTYGVRTYVRSTL